MTRLENNLELLYKLEALIFKNEDMRFSQILQNYGFIKPSRAVKDPSEQSWQNEFYLESEDLLKRVKQRIEDMKK